MHDNTTRPLTTSGVTNHDPATYHPTVGFVSLGCPKALVDAERMITQLQTTGYNISATFADADVVVVNTCGFINAAIEESLAAIGEAMTHNGSVIVTGCLGKDAPMIRAAYPAVLAITGPQAYAEVMEAIHNVLPAPQHVANQLPPQGIKLTPHHYAYLKIAEGCDHKCSFCIIPQLRGKLVSRPIGEVLNEAEILVQAGVRELLVIAQDTSAYGYDRKYRTEFFQGRALRCHLTTLATELGTLSAWIRLHYVYPHPQVEELIPLMAAGHILPYLDMPLQHANLRILRAMRRPAATANVLERINNWRQACPELILRSTFIVGFPGETEAEFTELLDFLQAAQLDRVGCFPYSPVENAAANSLAHPVTEAVKQTRYARFMTAQTKISKAKLARRIGQRMIVLVDKVEENQVIARSSADAPEIDGTVIIAGAWELDPGDFIEVTITAAGEHDLWGTPVED